MRRVLLLACLLLVPLVPTASATSHLQTEFDVRDPTGDARAFPDVRLPQTDIVRFTSRIDGADVVQTVHVVGPLPENNYWVQVRTTFGNNEYLDLKVERTNSSGSNARPTDYPTSFFQSTNAARVNQRVNFTFERDATTLTLRWPAAEIPAAAKCFAPSVTTLSRTTVEGNARQVDDELDVLPSECIAQDARTDGLTGSCPAPASGVAKAATFDDPRNDVGKRNNFAFDPHTNATVDILSLQTRLDDGWVVQTVRLAEPSPRDVVDLAIENQFRGNESDFERGAYASITLLGTSAMGTIIGEDIVTSFHVRAERVEPAGWELRWCASVLPADAECFWTTARVSLQRDIQDRVGDTKDSCPGPDGQAEAEAEAEAEEDAAAGAEGSGDEGAEDAGSNGSPGFGVLALLGAALVALALRRRA